VLERALGGGSVDHLEGIEEGDETSLNSTRWLHASFFNRTKRLVAQNWDPASIHARRDPTGRVYGTKTRITKVRVTLDRRGKVEKIYVIEPSGVDFLDDEAVRAFRAASPFPNLPEELAGDPFTFGFYFEIGDQPKWKIFRSQ
jgi:TonB family protein